LTETARLLKGKLKFELVDEVTMRQDSSDMAAVEFQDRDRAGC